MFYWIAKIIVYPIVCLLFFFPWVKGLKNLKLSGPAILICNHYNVYDPVLLAVLLPRPICFMAKSELYKYKWFSVIMRWLHAFPVRRGTGDVAAIKNALTVLKKGKLLGIFPEGTRNRGGNMGLKPFEEGVALIALKSKAPIIPVCIKKPYGVFQRPQFTIGEPLELSAFYDQKITGEVLDKASFELYRVLLTLKESA